MITEYWQRIISWANNHAPRILDDLNPAATDNELKNLEAVLGLSLPNELRDSLRVYNGESEGWPCKVFADYGAYLGTHEIADTWKQLVEVSQELSQYQEDMPDIEEQISDGIIIVEGSVRPEMFLREWIPIMNCNGDVFWALDMAPAEGGKAGQIIEVDWEGCSWKVIADSLSCFLQQYVGRLESGEYRIVDGLPTLEEDDS